MGCAQPQSTQTLSIKIDIRVRLAALHSKKADLESDQPPPARYEQELTAELTHYGRAGRLACRYEANTVEMQHSEPTILSDDENSLLDAANPTLDIQDDEEEQVWRVTQELKGKPR